MSLEILETAERFCEGAGLRFTETRRVVLDILARSQKPMTAYEILDALEGGVKNPKPPIVYRATDFWQRHGFVHKIESLNRFVVCQEGHQHRGSQFMICDECGDVSEIHMCHMPEAIVRSAERSDFKTVHWNLELHGQCQNCC